MNALAEDQLERLRGLLAGRGIPFGMYVGKSPAEEAGVRGERMPAALTQPTQGGWIDAAICHTVPADHAYLSSSQ